VFNLRNINFSPYYMRRKGPKRGVKEVAHLAHPARCAAFKLLAESPGKKIKTQC
jgi:hypothetical protein